jgi:hypothetical protein
MKDEYLAEENEETVLELASRYTICAREKEVCSACNAVSTMFANRGDIGKAKETFQMMTANEVRPDVYSFTALMRAELNAFLSPVRLHHQKEEEKNARTDEIVSRVEEALEGEEEGEHITRKTFIKDDIHKKEDEDELEDRLDATFARVEALRERMLDAGIVPDAASFVTELVLSGKFYASMMDRDGITLRLVQDRRRRVSNILLRMQILHVKMDVTASGVMFEDAIDLYVLKADSTSLFLDKAPINALYAMTSIFTCKICIRSKIFDTRRRRSWTKRKVMPSRSIIEA